MIRSLHLVLFLMFLEVGSLRSVTPSLIESNSNNLTAEDFDRMAMEIRKKAVQQPFHNNESSDEEYKKAVRLSIIWKKGENKTPLAHQLFEKLAESGNSKAAWQLGFDYEHARGVKSDPKKAFEWYKKAADWGNIDGLYDLGSCYYDGTGVQRDYKQALKLFLEAAYNGNKNAFSILPDMYWHGIGTTKDEIEALAWIYVRDANHNYERNEKLFRSINGIENDLGTQATLAAQQRAKEISNKITFK